MANGFEYALGGRFDLGEVIATFPHLSSKLGIRAPRLLRCRVLLTCPSYQLLMQSDERLEGHNRKPAAGVHVRQPQRGVQRALLGTLQGDLQSGPATRRLGGK